MYDRIVNLFSDKKLAKLQQINVLLIGVGGVGSSAVEVLVRSGIRNITIVDYDVYEVSNLNRQLHATRKTIGKSKVDTIKKHLLDLDEKINVNAINMRLDKESQFDFSKFNYVIDACDSIDAKIYLIKSADEYNIKLISCLGVGNRVDSTRLKITNLSKTVNDPLAKKLRHELKKENFMKDVCVVASDELPLKLNPVSSYASVSMNAGILLADFVIKDVLHEKD